MARQQKEKYGMGITNRVERDLMAYFRAPSKRYRPGAGAGAEPPLGAWAAQDRTAAQDKAYAALVTCDSFSLLWEEGGTLYRLEDAVPVELPADYHATCKGLVTKGFLRARVALPPHRDSGYYVTTYVPTEKGVEYLDAAGVYAYPDNNGDST